MPQRPTRRSTRLESNKETKTASDNILEFYNGQKLQLINETADENDSKYQVKHSKSEKFESSLFVKWQNLLAEVFLPKGFPSSVTPDYVEYQIWDTIQACASSLSGTLATAAVLKGAGVGNETATVLAASLSWVLKDGVGMLGRILFAWAFGNALDSDCKRWRLAADFLNDLAFCIDLTCSHTAQSFFMFTVCCSSLMRAIVGVAGGGTRMAVIRHQARRENFADVAAKDGSQETLVGIISLLASLIILPAVDERPNSVWTLFALLTVIHLLANYLAVRSLQLDIFNEERLKIVASHFIQTNQILSIREANKQENLLTSCFIPRTKDRKYGCSLLRLNEYLNVEPFINEDEIKAQIGWTKDSGRNYGAVAVHKNATPRDALMAAFELEFRLNDNEGFNIPTTSNFQAALEHKGWNTDSHLLLTDEYTFDLNN